jgi:hypothetical protein
MEVSGSGSSRFASVTSLIILKEPFRYDYFQPSINNIIPPIKSSNAYFEIRISDIEMASERRTPTFEYRVPISGSGRGIRKSASHEPLTRNSSSSEDDSPGGKSVSDKSKSRSLSDWPLVLERSLRATH